MWEQGTEADWVFPRLEWHKQRDEGYLDVEAREEPGTHCTQRPQEWEMNGGLLG